MRGLSDADLEAPIGPAEGPFADYPMADLILHINREVIHHGAEIACYCATFTPTPPDKLEN